MNILTLNLLLSTAIFWIVARLYVVPRLATLEPRAVLMPILLLHGMRHLGLMFLAPGAVDAGMPLAFARPAALGDVVSAALAMAALAALVARAHSARLLVWIFSIVGTLDLLNAITLATIHDAAPHMGAAWWIPAFWVPALLVTHALTFMVLRTSWRTASRGVVAGTAPSR